MWENTWAITVQSKSATKIVRSLGLRTTPPEQRITGPEGLPSKFLGDLQISTTYCCLSPSPLNVESKPARDSTLATEAGSRR